jgi:hypothetical protein
MDGTAVGDCFANLCGSAYNPNPETVYSYIGTGLPVRIAVKPADPEAAIFVGVLTDCAAETACVAAGGSAGPAGFTEVEAFLGAGVTYYIVVQPIETYTDFYFFFDEIDHQPFVEDDETVALWHLDEGSGQSAAALPDASWDLQLGSTPVVEADDPWWFASDQFAEPGGMLGFDGLGMVAATTAAVSLDLSDRFSIEAWVQPAGGATDGMIVALGDQAAMYRNADGRLECWVAGDPPATAVGETVLEGDTWYYVACTWGPEAGLTAWVDGLWDQLAGTVGAGLGTATSASVGASPAFSIAPFYGSIDEIRVSSAERDCVDIGAGW